MGTTPAGVTLHPIFWLPSGYTYQVDGVAYAFQPGYQSTIDGFFTNIAAGSGVSNNVFNVITQYYQIVGGAKQFINYDYQAGSELDDADAFPTTSGCPPDTGYSICLSNQQVGNELQTYLAAASLPANYANEYVLFLPPGVESYSGGSYHSSTTGTVPYIYAVIPYPRCATGCAGSGGGIYPFSLGGVTLGTDTLVGVAHEVIESITDPLITAWKDAADAGNDEIEDICPSFAVQTVGPAQYTLTEVFSNSAFAADPSSGGCVGSNPIVLAVPTSPSITNVPTAPAYGGEFTASVSTNGDGITSVTSNATSVCTVNGFTVSFVGVGTCSLTAHVAAGTNYSSADGMAQSFAVGQASQSPLSLTSLSGTFAVALPLTSSGGSGTGAVSYVVTSAGSAGCSINATTLSETGAGSCTVTVTKAVDANYLAASSTSTVVVAKAAQLALRLTSKTHTYRSALQLASIGGNGTGKVSYALASAGTAGCTLVKGTSLRAKKTGTCRVTAIKAGDSNYDPVHSPTTTVTFT
jgi:hypothetical protein